MPTPRHAAGPEDLATAVRLLSAAWRADAPHVAGTPAALEWWYALIHPDPLGEHLRLWFEGSQVVAWSWHEPPELEWHVWSGDPRRDAAVFGAVLDVTIAEAGDGEVGAFAADGDAASIDALRTHGFQPDGRRLTQWQRRAEDGPLPTARLPDGYRIRGLHGPEEFADRVALHRAAFPASRLTVDKYARLPTVPHYRFEDDLVVETSDGILAAYALTWYDADGRVGELEPVGTHPDHQRRGLSRAVVTAGVARLFERGARVVQVYSDASEPPAEALYAATGFRRYATHQRYSNRPAGATRPSSGSGGATIGT